MKFSIRKIAAAVGVAGLASVAVPLAVSQSAGAVGPNIYAVDNQNRIVTLTSDLHNNPATILAAHTITDLEFEDEEVVGLDRNPHDGQLYVVGRSADYTIVYAVDPTTGDADALAVLEGFDEAPIQLEGSLFAVDILPSDNVISIISDTGQSIVAALGVVFIGPFEFLNPGDGFIQQDTSVTGLSGSAFTPNDPDCDCEPTLYTTSRNRLYTTDIGTGVTTLVSTLQSNSHLGFESGLDVVTSGDGSTAYYSRTVSPPAGVNSSVYTINLTNGTTTRLLTTPTGVSLREIAL